MMRWAMGAVAVLAATACSAERDLTYRELEDLARRSTREQIARPPPDSCRMAEFQSLIGKPESEIDRSALPTPSRVVCHDCVITMDFNAQRLNVILGADGRVESLRCG
jgi:hypothetical protein